MDRRTTPGRHDNSEPTGLHGIATQIPDNNTRQQDIEAAARTGTRLEQKEAGSPTTLHGIATQIPDNNTRQHDLAAAARTGTRLEQKEAGSPTTLHGIATQVPGNASERPLEEAAWTGARLKQGEQGGGCGVSGMERAPLAQWDTRWRGLRGRCLRIHVRPVQS